MESTAIQLINFFSLIRKLKVGSFTIFNKSLIFKLTIRQHQGQDGSGSKSRILRVWLVHTYTQESNTLNIVQF